MEDDQLFKVAARQNGLLIQRVERDFDFLLKLNLPAVLEFYLQEEALPDTDLAKTNGRTCFLVERGGRHPGGQDQLTSYWSRVAYVAWKDFLNLPDPFSSEFG